MGDTCNVCLMKGFLEHDNHYAENQLVCTACGAVVENANLVSDETSPSAFGTTFHLENGSVVLNGTNVPVNMRNIAFQKSMPKAAKFGLATIKQLAPMYKLNATMTTRSNNLYKQAVRNMVFLRISQKKKLILAACCVYVVLRECNCPVTLSSLCDHISVTCHEFRPIYDKFVQAMGINITSTSIEDAIPFTLNNIICENRQRLFQVTANLLQIAREAWITSGRASQPLICASAFLAWKSMNPSQVKSSLSLFCKTVNLPYSKTTVQRVAEITAMLMKLAGQLPWIRQKQITKRNVALHLDSILKYATSLQLSVQAQQEGDSDSKCNMSDKERDVNSYKAYRFSHKKVIMDDRETEEEAKAAHNEYLVGLSSVKEDQDISDAEIEKYIRSDKEVQALQCIKQLGEIS